MVYGIWYINIRILQASVFYNRPFVWASWPKGIGFLFVQAFWAPNEARRGPEISDVKSLH